MLTPLAVSRITPSALLPAGVHLLPITLCGNCVIVVTDAAGDALAGPDMVTPGVDLLDACAQLFERAAQHDRDRRTAEHVAKGLAFLLAM